MRESNSTDKSKTKTEISHSKRSISDEPRETSLKASLRLNLSRSEINSRQKPNTPYKLMEENSQNINLIYPENTVRSSPEHSPTRSPQFRWNNAWPDTNRGQFSPGSPTSNWANKLLGPSNIAWKLDSFRIKTGDSYTQDLGMGREFDLKLLKMESSNEEVLDTKNEEIENENESIFVTISEKDEIENKINVHGQNIGKVGLTVQNYIIGHKIDANAKDSLWVANNTITNVIYIYIYIFP